MDQQILPQKYVDLRHNTDYVSVWPATMVGEIETRIYKSMVENVRGINSSAKVLGKLKLTKWTTKPGR